MPGAVKRFRSKTRQEMSDHAIAEMDAGRAHLLPSPPHHDSMWAVEEPRGILGVLG